MNIKTTYIVLFLSSLMLFSCNNEEMIPSGNNKELIEMPVTISITSRNTSQIATKVVGDDGMVEGTSDVNEILLLVYSGPTTTTDITQLTYHSQQKLACLENGRMKIAHGSITATANTNYAIFALGYNKDNDATHFTTIPTSDNLIAGETIYGNTIVSLIKTGGTPDSYKTPELFAGNVMPQGATDFVFTAQADEKIDLTGTLYRAVGKCSITLTEIPANIKKLSWLTEKMPATNHLYNETYANATPKYPMGCPPPEEQIQSISEVASVEHAGNEVWNTTLESFFIPLSESHFYIDATDDKGITTRYLVKCADKMYNTIWIAWMGYGVTNYYFYIVPNHQISISGTFDKLRFSGNIKIDLSEMEEYNGGLLE